MILFNKSQNKNQQTEKLTGSYNGCDVAVVMDGGFVDVFIYDNIRKDNLHFDDLVIQGFASLDSDPKNLQVFVTEQIQKLHS